MLRGLQVSRVLLGRLLLFTLLFAIFEGVGIGMMVPILEYVQFGDQAAAQSTWKSVFSWLKQLGVPQGAATILILLSISFSALVIRSVLHYFRDIDAQRLKTQSAAILRKSGIKAILQADRVFLAKHSSGRLLTSLMSEADRAAESVAARVVFTSSLVLTSAYVVLLFLLSVRLTLLSIPAFLLIGLLFGLQSRLTARRGARVSTVTNRLGSMVMDQLRGINRIKMRGCEQAATNTINRTIDTLAEALFSIERLRVLVDIGTFPILVLAAFSLLYVAVTILDMTLASLGIFMFVMVRLAPQVTLMNSLWSHIHGCTRSYHSLEELIGCARDHGESSQGSQQMVKLQREVRFAKVNFSYSSQQGQGSDFKLLDISFHLPHGAITALVGRSGSGKSTVAGLLTRFHDPASGAILWDERPVWNFDLASYRRHIALVPQEPYLFDVSLRENLNYGIHPPRTDAELMKILEEAGCLDFVSRLSGGLDSRHGEGGVTLSPGQRQRLAIAHALASDPDLLIMDEPTSALDAESDAVIQTLMSTWRGRLTILIIAHRFASIRHADNILVLDNGRLTAQGSHSQLLQTSVRYARLFTNQRID